MEGLAPYLVCAFLRGTTRGTKVGSNMSGFDANDFQGGIQPGSPDGTGGGNPTTDPNAPAGAAPGGDGQQPPADREGWIPRDRFD